ncbi:MAG: hypothetical protein ABW154_08320 [Dyella sp.]
MKNLTPGRSAFNLMGLLQFVLFCTLLGWAIASRSRVVNIGLMLAQLGWLVLGSATLLARAYRRHRGNRRG